MTTKAEVRDFAKQLFADQEKVYQRFMDANDKALREAREGFQASTETRKAVEALNTKLQQIEDQQKRLAGILKAGARQNELREKFNVWLRTGFMDQETLVQLAPPNRLIAKMKEGPEYRKALSVSDGTTGGVLAEPEYERELLREAAEYSPVRSIARVRPTKANTLLLRRRTSPFTAQWVKETGTRTEAAGLAWAKDEIPTHEVYAYVDVPHALLVQDSVDIEQVLLEEFAEARGTAEGTAFITGNGVGKPEGILHDTGIAYTANGNAATLQADALLSLEGDIKDSYARRGTWALNRSTIKTIKKLKDGQGQYLWQPGRDLLGTPTIIDHPYVECPDMPAIAADAYPIAFGDFKRGYTIADHVGIIMLRDPYTNPGYVRFNMYAQVGGQPTIREAIRKLKIAVT